MSKKLAVIVGAGPGLGVNVARTFGEHGFHVVLVARDGAKLEALQGGLRGSGLESSIQTADASDAASLSEAFAAIKREHGPTDVLVYNAALLVGGLPTSLDNETFMRHYQVDVASALHCANLVLPDMLGRGDGAILFTGGGFALHPVAEYACISIDKAALRALAFALSGEVRERGVYVGTVTVMGNIAPGTRYDPSLIAQKYWELYERRDAVECVLE